MAKILHMSELWVTWDLSLQGQNTVDCLTCRLYSRVTLNLAMNGQSEDAITPSDNF